MVDDSILTAKKTAFISFAIGTFLFLLFVFITQSLKLIYLGFAYVLGAIIINSIVMHYLVYLLLNFPRAWKKLILTCLIVLSNIPISMLYLYVILILI